MWRVISSRPRCWQLAKPCASSTSQARCVGTPWIYDMCSLFVMIWYDMFVIWISLVLSFVIIVLSCVIIGYDMFWSLMTCLWCVISYMLSCVTIYVMLCVFSSKYSCVMICYEICLRMSIKFIWRTDGLRSVPNSLRSHIETPRRNHWQRRNPTISCFLEWALDMFWPQRMWLAVSVPNMPPFKYCSPSTHHLHRQEVLYK